MNEGEYEMDVKLENLIEKIKKEGVEEAEHTSGELINNSKKEAAQIIQKAKDEAEKIVENAEKEAAKFQNNAELALQQAARDTELLTKEKITALLDDVLKKQVGNTLTPDFLKDLVLKIVGEWAQNTSAEVVLSGKDKEKLQDLLNASMQEELKKSVTIKLGDSTNKGFSIGLKDNDIFYDISDESITDILKTFLNPNLKEIMEKQNG
jgi:V/A-type H+-transporting ATPase subunit E